MTLNFGRGKTVTKTRCWAETVTNPRSAKSVSYTREFGGKPAIIDVDFAGQVSGVDDRIEIRRFRWEPIAQEHLPSEQRGAQAINTAAPWRKKPDTKAGDRDRRDEW